MSVNLDAEVTEMPANVNFGRDWEIVVVAVAGIVSVKVLLWYQEEFPLVFVDVWFDDEFCQEVAQPVRTLICFRVGVDIHCCCASVC